MSTIQARPETISSIGETYSPGQLEKLLVASYALAVEAAAHTSSNDAFHAKLQTLLAVFEPLVKGRYAMRGTKFSGSEIDDLNKLLARAAYDAIRVESRWHRECDEASTTTIANPPPTTRRSV